MPNTLFSTAVCRATAVRGCSRCAGMSTVPTTAHERRYSSDLTKEQRRWIVPWPSSEQLGGQHSAATCARC